MKLTLAQAKELGITIPEDVKTRRSKHGAIATEYNGRTYASKAEAQRAMVLDDLLFVKRIREWWPQPKYRLGNNVCIYIGDFLVIDDAGRHWTEDVKGRELPKFKRDAKLWALYGRHPLVVIGASQRVIPGGLQAEPWPEWCNYLSRGRRA